MKYLLKPNKCTMRTNGLLTLLMFVSVMGFGQVDPYLSGRACMSQELYDSAVYYLEMARDLNPGETEILLLPWHFILCTSELP